jgi:hypothetical protein
MAPKPKSSNGKPDALSSATTRNPTKKQARATAGSIKAQFAHLLACVEPNRGKSSLKTASVSGSHHPIF